MVKERVLVVDDEQVICELLKDLLQDRGFSVDYVLSGLEGIDRAKKESFDVVITDLKMPDIDGIQVLEEVKKNDPDTVVIVITGYPSFDTVRSALRQGAFDYVTKPFNIDEISFLIKRAIEFRNLSVSNKNLLKELSEENTRLDKKVVEKTKGLSLVYQITRDVCSSLKLNKVLDTIVARVTRALDVEICSLLLFDRVKQQLVINASQGLSDEVVANTRMNLGELISGWVFQNNEAVLVENIESDSRFSRRNQEKYYTHSFISIPLIVKGETIGVLNVNNKKNKDPFTEDDFRLIKNIAQEVAIGIENAKLYSSIEETYVRMVKTLSSIIDLKDNYTSLHSRNVARYAVIIAQELRLNKDEIDTLKLSCELHDIGKIGIHDQILVKAGKLTREEWEEMKTHPLKGVQILEHLLFLDKVIALIAQHHERYDGKGYPYGLRGEDIELGSRIMAIADSYDAMTSPRPYRQHLFSKEEAVEEIKANSGSQFDPKLVEVFLRVADKM